MISSKKYRYNIKNIDIISKKYLKIYVDILIFFRYRKKKYRYYIRYQLYIRYISDILDIYLRYIWYNIWYKSDFLDIISILFGLKISTSLAIISKKYSNNINKISIFEKNIRYKSDKYQNIRYISDIVKKKYRYYIKISARAKTTTTGILAHFEKMSLARWFWAFFVFFKKKGKKEAFCFVKWAKTNASDRQDEANKNAESFPTYRILAFEVW